MLTRTPEQGPVLKMPVSHIRHVDDCTAAGQGKRRVKVTAAWNDPGTDPAPRFPYTFQPPYLPPGLSSWRPRSQSSTTSVYDNNNPLTSSTTFDPDRFCATSTPKCSLQRNAKDDVIPLPSAAAVLRQDVLRIQGNGCNRSEYDNIPYADDDVIDHDAFVFKCLNCDYHDIPIAGSDVKSSGMNGEGRNGRRIFTKNIESSKFHSQLEKPVKLCKNQPEKATRLSYASHCKNAGNTPKCVSLKADRSFECGAIEPSLNSAKPVPPAKPPRVCELNIPYHALGNPGEYGHRQAVAQPQNYGNFRRAFPIQLHRVLGDGNDDDVFFTDYYELRNQMKITCV